MKKKLKEILDKKISEEPPSENRLEGRVYECYKSMKTLANHPYLCYLCNAEIKLGDEYYKISFRLAGTQWTYRTKRAVCLKCYTQKR